MTLAFSLVVAVGLGLCLGSFLNVVIYRLPRGMSLARPGSRCGFCRSAIQWFSNIPVLSYLIQQGSCRKCGHHFSLRYPVVELLCALLFVVLWDHYGWGNELWILTAFTLTLVAASFIDLDFKIIPDEMSLGGWALGLLLAGLNVPGFPVSLQEALAASFLAAAFFFILSRLFYLVRQEMGLGDGDIKLMGFIGAFLGFQGAVSAVLVGSIAGTLTFLFLMAFGKQSRTAAMPFGPFLAMGALVTVFNLDFWWGLH